MLRLRLLTPTPAVLKNRLWLPTRTPAVSKNRLRLPTPTPAVLKTDSDSSWKHATPLTPTPDSDSDSTTLLKTEKYSMHNRVGFMQARWGGEAFVLISTRYSFVFSNWLSCGCCLIINWSKLLLFNSSQFSLIPHTNMYRQKLFYFCVSFPGLQSTIMHPLSLRLVCMSDIYLFHKRFIFTNSVK